MSVTSIWVSGLGDSKYKNIKSAFTASDLVESRLPKATGGSDTGFVNGYRYHFFTGTSASTLTVTQAGFFEIMVVGAGGGGGRFRGGGGGGGAKEPASGYQSQYLNVGSYSCIVAPGGAGSTSNSVAGQTSTDSSFIGSSTLSAKSGGGGASQSAAAVSGGSGGGARGDSGQTGAAAGTGSNVNAGGNGADRGAGGGGGGTAVGGNGGVTVGGNGGQGITLTNIDNALSSSYFLSTFNGITTICSGGGGGVQTGPGGTAGTNGGNGVDSDGAPGGTANGYGCGGGGSGSYLNSSTQNGGSGFKGLIVIRYLSRS